LSTLERIAKNASVGFDRAAAIQELRAHSGAQMEAAFADPDPYVRQTVVECFGREDAHFPRISRMQKEDPSLWVRCACEAVQYAKEKYPC